MAARRLPLKSDYRFYFHQDKGRSTSIDKDVFSPHLDPVTIDSHGRVLLHLPGRDVVFPTVPGAGHDGSVQDPLPERPAPVQAGIVNGVVFAPDVRQGYRLAFHLELPDRPRCDFIGLCRSRERHRDLLPGIGKCPTKETWSSSQNVIPRAAGNRGMIM